jgi:hypothetical protein
VRSHLKALFAVVALFAFLLAVPMAQGAPKNPVETFGASGTGAGELALAGGVAATAAGAGGARSAHTDFRTPTALSGHPRVSKPGNACFTLQHHLGGAGLAHSGVPQTFTAATSTTNTAVNRHTKGTK